MSEHTKGRLTSESNGSAYQRDLNTADGRTVATAGPGNARRLAAAWNACEGMETDDIEELAACQGVMMLTVYADDKLNELNAARALLREAVDTIEEFPDEDHEIADRIKVYLDACDKPGAPDAS